MYICTHGCLQSLSNELSEKTSELEGALEQLSDAKAEVGAALQIAPPLLT